jgi:hypothetical protein
MSGNCTRPRTRHSTATSHPRSRSGPRRLLFSVPTVKPSMWGNERRSRWRFRSNGAAKHHGVVSANGQNLSALNSLLGTTFPGGPVRSAQQSIQAAPQSLTNCNPCVTVGLTPAPLAILAPEHLQCRPERKSHVNSEFQCAGHQQVRAVQFHPGLRLHTVHG